MVLCLPWGGICSALCCGNKTGRQCGDDVAQLLTFEEGDALFLSFSRKKPIIIINNLGFMLQNFNNWLYPGASPSATLADPAFFFLYIFLEGRVIFSVNLRKLYFFSFFFFSSQERQSCLFVGVLFLSQAEIYLQNQTSPTPLQP